MNVKKNRIDLIPIGGLGNSMLVIASAYEIAEKNKTKLRVLWKKNEECYIDFEDVFVPIKNSIIDVVKIYEKQFFYRTPSQKNFYFPAAFTSLFKWDIDKYYVELSEKWGGGFWRKLLFLALGKRERENSFLQKNISDLLKDKNSLVITCNPLTKQYFPGKLFSPALKLKKNIDLILSEYSENTIGIHIRRTDHRIAMSKSPIELFYKKMQDEIEKDANVKFFLATDSNDVKEKLISDFEKRIIYYNSSLIRNSEDGMNDAVIELFCLSKTEKILGSFFSTYSEMSSKIGNIELEIVI
jgi:hypothetical protein